MLLMTLDDHPQNSGIWIYPWIYPHPQRKPRPSMDGHPPGAETVDGHLWILWMTIHGNTGTDQSTHNPKPHVQTERVGECGVV